MTDLFNIGFVFVAFVFLTLQGLRIDYLERQLVELRGRPAGPKEFRIGAILRPMIPIVAGLVIGFSTC